MKAAPRDPVSLEDGRLNWWRRRARENMTGRINQLIARCRARRYVKPGRAVIVDTETTDMTGRIIEIAVIDAATGQPLVDMLINPETRIQPGALEVHGITDAMCATAPTWAEAWQSIVPHLLGRTVLAYNAPYDRDRIRAECHRTGHIPPRRWACLMRLDARLRRTHRWRTLEGGHRALGDAQAARERLLEYLPTPDRRGMSETFRAT